MSSLKYNWPNVTFAVFTLTVTCFFIVIGIIGTAVVAPFYANQTPSNDSLLYLLIIIFPSLGVIFMIFFMITLCLIFCNRRYFVTDNPYHEYP